MILENIISPLSTDEFFDKIWPDSHLVLHGNEDRWNFLLDITDDMDLEQVLYFYKNAVMVVGKAVIEASEGIADRMLVPPDKALYWYDEGAALEFDFLDMWLPKADRKLQLLKQELGLLSGTTAKMVMYAAKNGGGFKAHFDAYANFVFQLKGNKNWKLMRNNNVDFPTQHYDLSEKPFIPEEIMTYWNGEFPSENLDGAESVVLSPGSMLFLPRGYWHKTESNEETLSLNITLSQPTWLDLILAELRIRLVQEKDFRKLVDEREIERFSKNIGEYLQRVGNIEVKDILERGKDELDIYQQTQYIFRQTLKL